MPRILMMLSLALSLNYAQNNASSVPLPPSASTLKMQIEQVKQAMTDEEKQWADEKSRDAEAEIQRQKRFNDLGKEKAELQKQISASEQKVQNAIAMLESNKMQKREYEGRFTALNQKILEHTLAFDMAMQNTMPYQTDKRKDQGKLLASDIRQNKVTPEEAFSRLASLYDKESRITSDAEFWSGEITLQNGNRMAVKYLRLGKQVMLYSNPTGSSVGILRKRNNKEWVWFKEDQLDFDTRKAITNAINIAEGKSVPGLADIPFWIQDFPVNNAMAQGTKK
jgi:hypothetical protein